MEQSLRFSHSIVSLVLNLLEDCARGDGTDQAMVVISGCGDRKEEKERERGG